MNQQVLKTRSDNTGLNVASTYDLMGHLIRAQFANSSGTVSYSYDAIGRVLTTTDMFGQTLSYQYDQASLRTLMTFQDGTQQIYQYNAGNQLNWTGISGSTVGYGVGYDAFDRPTTITRANSANTAIGYDNADRVTSYGHSFATTSRNVTWGFSFNPAGGIVGVTTTNTDFDYREQQSATESHTFNGLNQDSAIAALATTCSAANAGYDCSGNLTNDSNRHFTYDIDNHLTALSGPASASYVYDPIGRLVQTTVNSTVTRFLYDGVNLVAEYDGLGAIQRRYMHTLGTDQPWVQFTGSAVGASNAKYLYADYHGSIIALADNTGAVANADIYKYGTYGEPLDINNNPSFSGSRFRYTGQTVLPEASLYYYKARVYDPVFGRFLQTDPVGGKDNLDLYAYVGDDPGNKTDPTGLQTVPLSEEMSDADYMATMDAYRDMLEGLAANVLGHGTPTDPRAGDLYLDWERGTGSTNRVYENNSAFSRGFAASSFTKSNVRDALSFWRDRDGGDPKGELTNCCKNQVFMLNSNTGEGHVIGSFRLDGKRQGDRIQWTATNKVSRNSFYGGNILHRLHLGPGVPNTSVGRERTISTTIKFETDLNGNSISSGCHAVSTGIGTECTS